jgi:hypothetical protein
MEKHCPDCEQKIEDMTVVQEADPDSFGEAAFNPDIDAEEAFKIAREEKKKVRAVWLSSSNWRRRDTVGFE